MNTEDAALQIILDNKFRIAPRYFEECRTYDDVRELLCEKFGAQPEDEEASENEPDGPVNMQEYKLRKKKKKKRK